jgi:hypothetical protein
MLRTLAFVLMLGAPSLAMAEQFPQSATGAVVRGHDGAELGRVAAVERNANGDVVAAEIPGLEPGDAPYASSDLVAENRSNTPASQRQRASEARVIDVRASGNGQIRTR